MTVKTIGIVGGGQLGRMSALAAARLGLECIIYTPERGSPASQVCGRTIVGAYDDEVKLAEFADSVDVITYEFENIPMSCVNFLKARKGVFPDSALLEVSQDRIAEKSFLNAIGIETARWVKVDDEASLHATLQDWGAQRCIIKTCRFGYDGKGQITYDTSQKLNDAICNLQGDLIAEEIVDFSDELSVIVARDCDGKTVTYGPMLNIHKNHILDKTIYPAPFSDTIKAQAAKIAETLAQSLKLRGLLTLELFLTRDGRLLANEIAPRTHNSGHWSLDACAVSQFENHIRAVAGLPVAPPAPHSAAEMLNLIGADIDTITPYYTQSGACVHLYGKADAKAGRKMGHITFLKPQS